MHFKLVLISIILGITTISAQENQDSHLWHILNLIDELAVRNQHYSKESLEKRSIYENNNAHGYRNYNDKQNEMNIQKLILFIKQNSQLDDLRPKSSLRDEDDRICRETGRCGCTGSRCDDRSDGDMDSLIESLVNNNNNDNQIDIKDLHKTVTEYLRNNDPGNIDLTRLEEAHRICIERGRCGCKGSKCRKGYREGLTNDKLENLSDTSEEQSSDLENDYDSKKMLLKNGSKKRVNKDVYIIDNLHGTHRLDSIESLNSIQRPLRKLLDTNKYKSLSHKPLIKPSQIEQMFKQNLKTQMDKLKSKKIKPAKERVKVGNKVKYDISRISQYNDKLTSGIANYIYDHYIKKKVARSENNINDTLEETIKAWNSFMKWLKNKMKESVVE